MKLNINTQSGFTLIELLVSISIIGLMASIVVTSLVKVRMKARDVKRVAEAKQVVAALNLYQNENGGLPQMSNDTTYCIGKSSSETCWNDPASSQYPSGLPGNDTLNSNIKKFMSSLPKDPSRLTGAGDRFLYRTGLGPAANSGVAVGCTNTYQTGIFLLWQPEKWPTYTDADCQGLGFFACCGAGGPCSGNGYYCAIRLDK